MSSNLITSRESHGSGGEVADVGGVIGWLCNEEWEAGQQVVGHEEPGTSKGVDKLGMAEAEFHRASSSIEERTVDNRLGEHPAQQSIG